MEFALNIPEYSFKWLNRIVSLSWLFLLFYSLYLILKHRKNTKHKYIFILLLIGILALTQFNLDTYKKSSHNAYLVLEKQLRKELVASLETETITPPIHVTELDIIFPYRLVERFNNLLKVELHNKGYKYFRSDEKRFREFLEEGWLIEANDKSNDYLTRTLYDFHNSNQSEKRKVHHKLTREIKANIRPDLSTEQNIDYLLKKMEIRWEHIVSLASQDKRLKESPKLYRENLIFDILREFESHNLKVNDEQVQQIREKIDFLIIKPQINLNSTNREGLRSNKKDFNYQEHIFENSLETTPNTLKKDDLLENIRR